MSRPHILLTFGIFWTGLGLMSTLSGQSLLRFGRTISRAQDPEKYWRSVAIDYLAGAFGIGYFLYEKFLAK
jgi:hypothetical protein